MKITIFTPTYNRAKELSKLYESLIIQKKVGFEWLIVDDGSSDNTEEVVNSWIKENKITIRYYKQENGGKHRAINNGVDLAKGELFFIVDSDDYLTKNALEIIISEYKEIQGKNDFCGISGTRMSSLGIRIGGDVNFSKLDCTTLEIRYKYHIQGDLAEVFITNILKSYKFPDIKGEKFCSECYIWNQLAEKYKVRYLNKPLVICEYLEGGLTCNSFKLRRNSPKYTALVYKQFTMIKIPTLYKIRYAINYWRFSFYHPKNESILSKLKFIGFKYFPLYFIGFLLYCFDNYNNKL